MIRNILKTMLCKGKSLKRVSYGQVLIHGKCKDLTWNLYGWLVDVGWRENGPWWMPRFHVCPIIISCYWSKKPNNLLKYLLKVRKTFSHGIPLQLFEDSWLITFCPNIWYTLSEYLMQPISIVTIFDDQFLNNCIIYSTDIF